MTVTTTKDALDLREVAARVAGLDKRTNDLPSGLFYQQNETGDTSTVAFAVPKGWKPLQVFEAGLLQREGSGEDYTMATDGFVWTVTFAVAPAAVDVTFLNMRILP
jgi:hypothetical protein